jgi:hypothetical protein
MKIRLSSRSRKMNWNISLLAIRMAKKMPIPLKPTQLNNKYKIRILNNTKAGRK